MRSTLYQKFGFDLTSLPGIDESTALKIWSELGTDFSKWKTVKHFTSWLGLCPGNKISGGKILNTSTRPSANRVSRALKLAAFSLFNSKTAIGAFLRRLRARLGAPKAITAVAHKLARLIYLLVTKGTEYVEFGEKAYEKQYEKRKLANMEKVLKEMGLEVTPIKS